jgi:hypothetical protein
MTDDRDDRDDRDLGLQALFAKAERELPAEAFSAQVMARIKAFERRARFARMALGLALAGCAWLLATPLQGAANLLVQGLASPLILIDDRLLGELLLPLNNVAAAALLGLAALGLVWRKIFSSPASRLG